MNNNTQLFQQEHKKHEDTFFFFNLFILLIYFWLRWVFVAAHGLSLVAVSGGLLIAVTSLVAEHRL